MSHVETQQNAEPYITPETARHDPCYQGDEGRLTRKVRNLRHPRVTDGDFARPAAIPGNRYKLVALKEMTTQAGARELSATLEEPDGYRLRNPSIAGVNTSGTGGHAFGYGNSPELAT